MNQDQLNELFETLSDSSEWIHQESFAGVSQELKQFTAQAVAISKEAVSDQRSRIIYCERLGNCGRIDEALVDILGFHGSRIVKLEAGADAHNLCEIFGMGARPSLLESTDEQVAIFGFEFLLPYQVSRFYEQTAIWFRHRFKKLLIVSNCNHEFEEKTPKIDGALISKSIIFPPLASRKIDIPFVIQDAARRCNGGLELVSLDGANMLISHSWHGDIEEIDRVVRALFSSSGEGLIEERDVKDCLSRTRPPLTRRGLPIDYLKLWQQVQHLKSEIDRLTTSLTGFSFFAFQSAATTKSPLESDWPELNFLRLVSWAYVTVIENAEPNLRIVAKLFAGQNLKADRVFEMRDSVGCLRTLLQHSLQYGEERDQDTIAKTAAWFEGAIGKPQPRQSDFENCIRHLLNEVEDLFKRLLHFLNRLNDDELRRISIAQWIDHKETEWPKHKFAKIVEAAIQNLGRQDLNVNVVCDKLLDSLRSRLKVTSENEDRQAILLCLAESEVDEKFPMTLPVSGSDIISLGVPKGPLVSEIRKAVQLKFESGITEKSKLLEYAATMAMDLSGNSHKT